MGFLRSILDLYYILVYNINIKARESALPCRLPPPTCVSGGNCRSKAMKTLVKLIVLIVLALISNHAY